MSDPIPGPKQVFFNRKFAFPFAARPSCIFNIFFVHKFVRKNIVFIFAAP